MMRSAIRFFSVLFVAGWVIQAGLSADRVALVVGVDQYDNLPPENQLKVAVQDATLLAETLRSVDPPFQVTLLQNADWKEAQTSFDMFLDQAKTAECALIYFAGHGVEYHGENFLLVKDSDVGEVSADVQRMKRRLGAGAISLQSWVDSLDSSQADVKLVILDCCRDNPLQVEDGVGTRSTVGARQGLAQVTPPSGTLISYSADAGQQANDGLFTPVLASNIRESNLPILKVFATTREQVRSISESWAEEDMAKGVPTEFRRVRHEPAEYNKLNVSGMDFHFNKSAAPGDDVESMKKQVAEIEKRIAEKEKTKPSDMVQRWVKIVEAMKASKPDKSPAFTLPSYLSTVSLGPENPGMTPGELRIMNGIEMIWCPKGAFTMGSPAVENDRRNDETEVAVTLSSGFWLARAECTQQQWESVMGSNPSKIKNPQVPVDQVSWEDCQEWVRQMNQSVLAAGAWKWALPTEAQWEYACRAGTSTVFGMGNSLGAADANISGGFPYGSAPEGEWKQRPVEVKSYRPNAWGLFDMHGNVAEWCRDWYGAYPAQPVSDPAGPATGEYRVLRGGDWVAPANQCRSATRGMMAPGDKLYNVGFRPAVVSVDTK